jgi:hypothetical protein
MLLYTVQMAMAVFTTAHKTTAIPHIGKQTVFCDVMLVSLIISEELSASTFSEADGSSMCFQKAGDHLAACASKRLVTI